MGEIVRLIILDLLQQELLFLGHRDTYGDYKTPLYNRGGFYTKFVSTVETDEGRSKFWLFCLIFFSKVLNFLIHVEYLKILVFEIPHLMIVLLFNISVDKFQNALLS
jgi:hypothetical protein